jgi:hypothetical protein
MTAVPVRQTTVGSIFMIMMTFMVPIVSHLLIIAIVFMHHEARRRLRIFPSQRCLTFINSIVISKKIFLFFKLSFVEKIHWLMHLNNFRTFRLRMGLPFISRSHKLSSTYINR